MCSAKALADVVLIKLNLSNLLGIILGHSMEALMHYVMLQPNYLITPKRMNILTGESFFLESPSTDYFSGTHYFAPTFQCHLHHFIGYSLHHHCQLVLSLSSLLLIDKFYPISVISLPFHLIFFLKAKLLIWHSIHSLLSTKWTCTQSLIFLLISFH